MNLKINKEDVDLIKAMVNQGQFPGSVVEQVVHLKDSLNELETLLRKHGVINYQVMRSAAPAPESPEE